jgi:hypothetical protein
MALVQAHQYGVYVWDMFFGFHLFVLGYLVSRSDSFPRKLGMAIVVGGLGYFLEGLIHVTFVHSAPLSMIVVGLLVLASVSELAFAFWLLIKGQSVTGGDENDATPTGGYAVSLKISADGAGGANSYLYERRRPFICHRTGRASACSRPAPGPAPYRGGRGRSPTARA